MDLLLARYGTLTKADIETVARETVASLNSCGFLSCLVGGAACMTYGITRIPNDIDIVVLNSGLTTEEIKNRLVSTNPSFFLVPSRNPRNTYKVLWYNLRGASSYLRAEHACKVDVLIPGIMNIPSVRQQDVVHTSMQGSSVPIMPFIAVLLLKLQGWADHRVSYRTDLRDKQHVDVADIYQLLRAAVQNNEMHVRNESWLPRSFVAVGKMRVADFIRTHADSAIYWRQIGLANP